MIRFLPVLFSLLVLKLNGQVTPACPTPPPPGAESCNTTCVYCDFDGYMGVNSGTPSGGSTVCGSIAIHNDQWFGFVAGSTSISIDILTSNCQNGDGLQAAFFDDCAADAIICNSGSGGGGGIPLNLSYSGFVPGQTYYLMIDGWTGDVCNYEIDVVDGSITPPPVTQPAPIQGPTQVCPGAMVTYFIPEVPGAGSYRWIGPPGSSINGGSNNVLIPAPEGTEVTVTFGNSGGTLCVTASNACSAPQTRCITITNQPIPPTIKDPMVICFEELPFQWDEAPYQGINGPGTYNLSSTPYDSWLGCDSVVRQTITVKPRIETNLGIRYICEGECLIINGTPYCETGGPHTETFSSFQGCDSIVRFSVQRINANAVVQAPPMITCNNPSITLNGAGSSTGPQITYFWYNNSWSQIGNTITQNTNTGGTYHLVVLGTGGGLACRDTATVTVSANNTLPGVTATGGTIGCLATNQQITLMATSPTPGVNYFWTGPGITPANALLPNPTVVATGNYSVAVTNPANNCTSTATVVVDANNNPPSATATGGIITCAASAVILGVSTNAPSATYNWAGPAGFNANSPNPSATAAGNYTVTVTNSVTGCTNTTSTAVTQNTALPTANAGPDGVINCNQSTVTLTGSGNAGGAPVWYDWTGPGITAANDSIANPVVNAAGQYILQIGNLSNGCTRTDTVTVTASLTSPTAVAGADQIITCASTSVTLSSAGSSSGTGFTRLWSGPGITPANENAANPMVNQPGTYNLLVTNTTNGCTATDQVSVTVNQVAPTANAGPDAVLTCTATNGIALQGSGTPAGVTFAWGGAGIGANNNNISNPVITQADTYTLVVTNPVNGCTASDQVTISQDANLPNANAGADRTLNCTVFSVDLNGGGSSSGPNISYLWTGPGITPANSTLPSPTGITVPGTYTLAVTNTANGCTNTDVVVVQRDTVRPVANAGADLVLNCYNGATDTLDASASSAGPNIVLQWTGAIAPGQTNSATPVVNTPGVYTLTVTNTTNTCTQTDAVSVVADIAPPSANAGSDAIIDCVVTATVLGVAPGGGGVQYAWTGPGITPATANIAQPTVSQPGTYTLVVTNPVNGCTASDNTLVTQNAVYPVADAGPDRRLTCTAPDAMLDGTASSNGASMQMNWTGPGITPAIAGAVTPMVSDSGWYVLTVIDQTNSCATTDTVRVDADQDAPMATTGPDGILNCLTTSLTLSSSGSSSGPDFAYEWTGASITPATASLSSPAVTQPDTYTLLVTNINNGCTDSDQVVISQNNTLPTANAGGDGQLTCAITSIALDGSASSSGTGFSYAWAGPGITIGNFNLVTPTVSDSGTYTLQVTNDVNFCTATDQVYVALDGDFPVTSAGPDQLLTCVVTSVTLDGSLSAAGPGIVYTWSGPGIDASNQDVQSPVVAVQGTYSITVTNSDNGCTRTDEVVVDRDVVSPFASAGAPPVLTCVTTSVALDGSGSDTGTGFSLLWSGPGITPANDTLVMPQVDVPGNYMLQVTNLANGCTETASVTVGEDVELPTASAGSDLTLNCDIQQVVLDGTASNSPGGILYTWQGPGITPINTNASQPNISEPGTYILTVQNPQNGCEATDQATVVIDTIRPVLTTTTATLTCAQQIGTISVSSSLPNTVFEWQGPGLVGGNTSTLPSPQVDGEGLYTVVALAPNGCSSTAQVVVTQDATLPQGSAEGGVLNCYNNGVDTISGIVLTPNATFRWTGPGGFTSMQSDPQVTVPGLYRFIIRGDNGCERTITVTVSSNFTAPTAMAVASNTLDCSTPTATIQGGGSSTGGQFSHVWSTVDGRFVSGTNSLNPVVDQPGAYTLLVTNNINGCTSTATASVLLDPSVPTGFLIDVKDIRCWGETNGRLRVDSVIGGTQPFQFVLLNQSGNIVHDFTNLAAGNYRLRLEDAKGCVIDTLFTIVEPQQLVVALGPDITVSLGDSVAIEAQIAYSTPIAMVQWVPASGCDSVDCERFWLKPFNSVNQQVTVIDENGCEASDRQLILLDRKRHVYIPNAFNPESAQNNLFQINCGIDVARIGSFQVFDRWGELLYEARDRAPNDPEVYWDGRAANRYVTPGVFVYVIEIEFIDGVKEMYTGDVTVVR